MTYARQPYAPRPSFIEEYEENRRISRLDFTRNAPNKNMEKLPLPKGLWGYTFLYSNYMAINDSLLPEQNRETQIHESIHTPDEYETRILTQWMIDLSDKRNPYFEREFKKEAIQEYYTMRDKKDINNIEKRCEGRDYH